MAKKKKIYKYQESQYDRDHRKLLEEQEKKSKKKISKKSKWAKNPETESDFGYDSLRKSLIGTDISKNPNESDMFLAQMGHESNNFKTAYEKLRKKDKNKYDNRSDLGNTKKGDGFKYRGRGYIQLTGKANYKKYGDLLGVDLVNKPDLAAKAGIASKIAQEYWKKRDIGPDARKGDLITTTKKIQGNITNSRGKVKKKYKKSIKSRKKYLRTEQVRRKERNIEDSSFGNAKGIIEVLRSLAKKRS